MSLSLAVKIINYIRAQNLTYDMYNHSILQIVAFDSVGQATTGHLYQLVKMCWEQVCTKVNHVSFHNICFKNKCVL